MTISLVLLAATALGLLAALGLFISLKREVVTRSRRESERVEAMLVRLVEAETRLATPPPPVFEPDSGPLRSGLNLSKRVQVMRLLRQGEGTNQIAAELRLSRAEVQLLASMQSIASQTRSKAAGAD